MIIYPDESQHSLNSGAKHALQVCQQLTSRYMDIYCYYYIDGIVFYDYD